MVERNSHIFMIELTFQPCLEKWTWFQEEDEKEISSGWKGKKTKQSREMMEHVLGNSNQCGGSSSVSSLNISLTFTSRTNQSWLCISWSFNPYLPHFIALCVSLALSLGTLLLERTTFGPLWMFHSKCCAAKTRGKPGSLLWSE